MTDKEVYDTIKGHAVTQSDAEPVAWRYRNPLGDGTWHLTKDSGLGRFYMNNPGFECEPLYTAPPRYDAALAQSDAEPVAGGLAKARTIALEQRCERGTPWDLACVTIANKIGEQCGYPPIPTDTAPPRPDASAGLIETADISEQVWQALCARADAFVGLIEAAEWHEEQALRFAASPYTSDKMRGMMHKEDAHKLRARAADRSRK